MLRLTELRLPIEHPPEALRQAIPVPELFRVARGG